MPYCSIYCFKLVTWLRSLCASHLAYSRSRWLLCCCNSNTTREGQIVTCASYSASYFSHTAWLHQRVLCKSYFPKNEAVIDSCHGQLFHGRTLPSCRAGIRFQHNLSVGSAVCMYRSARTDSFATQLSGASIPPGHSCKTVQTPTASTHCLLEHVISHSPIFKPGQL